MPYLNTVEYAKLRNVSQQAVSKAIKSGKISKEKNGLLDVAKCDAAWPLLLDQIAARVAAKPDQPPVLTRSSAEQLTLALKMAQVQNMRLKNKRIRGELVSRRVAEQAITSLAQVARQRIMAVARSASHLCVGRKQTEIVEILTRALERALADTLTALPDFVALDTDFASAD